LKTLLVEVFIGTKSWKKYSEEDVDGDDDGDDGDD